MKVLDYFKRVKDDETRKKAVKEFIEVNKKEFKDEQTERIS
jgi:hypothetical protein